MLLGRLQNFYRPFQLGWYPVVPNVAPYQQQTGLAPTVKISKNGGVFTDPYLGPTTCDDLGYGVYGWQMTANDCDTVGSLCHRFDFSGGTLTHVEVDQVVTALPGDPGTLTVAERVNLSLQIWGLSSGIELGMTPRDAMRVMFAVLAGKSTVGTGHVFFRNFGDTKTRCNVTYDVLNERIIVTYDFS